MAIKFLSGLNLSNVTAGSLLKLDSNGNIVAAVDGTDYNTASADSWSDVGYNIYRNSDVRIGTYQSGVAPAARLHVFEYQSTDPKLLIEDGNTGDASMQFKISTQQYTMGIDNSDSDKFKISAGSTFTTTDFQLDTNGRLGIGTAPVSGYSITTGGKMKSSLAMVVAGVETGNPQPASNNAHLSGYGIIGNRGTFYVTNGGGVVQIGVGSTHNANPIATFADSGITHSRSTTITSSGYVDLKVDQTDSAAIKMGVTSASTEGFVMTETNGSSHLSTDPVLKFLYNDGTVQEYGRFTTTGLGIGNTSPVSKLHVYASSSGATAYQSGNDGLIVERGGRAAVNLLSPANSDSYVFFANPTAGNAGYVGYQNTENRLVIKSSDYISLLDSTGEVVRIDGGNVGIGTTSPSAKLHVDGNSLFDGNVLVGSTYTQPSGSSWTTSNSQLILGGAHNAEVNNDNPGVKLLITGYDNDLSTAIYPIYAEDENGLVDFWIKNRQGSSSSPTMYFAGKFGVGTTSPGGNLHLEGNFESGKALVIKGTYGTDTEYYFRTHGTNSEYLALYAAGTRVMNFNSGKIQTYQGLEMLGGEIGTNSSNHLVIGSSVQIGQGDEDPVIEFKYGTTSLGKIDQFGDIHAGGFKVSGTTGFLKSDGTVESVTFGTMASETASDYYDSDAVESYVAQELTSYTPTSSLGTAATSAATDFVAVAGDTVTGQITFPTAIGNRPVFGEGIIARSDTSDTSGTHDIWGISERYYPSNSTAGDAWGIQWSGTPNEINFIGAGQKKLSIDLDTAGAVSVLGSVSVGGATFVDANRRNIYLDSFDAGGGAGIFFRDGFTYNASITAEDHNGSSADGICISGYDGISFSTGSNSKNEVVRITGGGSNVGRVGIGTSSPAYKLHVEGDSVYVTGGTSNGKWMRMYVNDSWAYLTTNLSKYYFNAELRVDGGKIGSYNEDLQLATGGTTRLTLSNTNGDATFTGDLIVPSSIVHSGDTNTSIGFGTDTINFNTGGGVRATFNDSGAKFNNNVIVGGGSTLSLGQAGEEDDNGRTVLIEGVANGGNGEGSGRIFFSENNNTATNLYGLSLYYEGDGNAQLPSGFQPNTGNATWSLRTHNNNSNGVPVIRGSRTDQNVTFGGNLYIPNVIYHAGDTNTYMQFHAGDQWRVVTGGAERLEVNNTYTTVQNDFWAEDKSHAGDQNWKTKTYVRAVGVEGGSIGDKWVHLTTVDIDAAYDKAALKFKIHGFDDVSCGTENIDVLYENAASSQETHRLDWYSTDGTASLFKAVKSTHSGSNLAHSYELWVQMAGDWRDTFTVEVETWTDEAGFIAYSEAVGQATAPSGDSNDQSKTSREWYTKNTTIYADGTALQTQSQADSRYLQLTGGTVSGAVTLGAQFTLSSFGTGVLRVDSGTVSVDTSNYLTSMPANSTVTSVTFGGVKVEESSDRPGLLEINRDGTDSWSGIMTKFSGTAEWALMGNETSFGLYDDQQNEWAWRYVENSYFEANHNGSTKLQTASNGVKILNVLELGNLGDTNGGVLKLNGTTANKQAVIKCTNGNLHIDSEDGNSLYLNYYEGTSDNIIFGNGNGGASGARVTSSGVVHATSVEVAGNLSVRNITARDIVSAADRTYSLGTDANRWAVVFCETLDSAGQHESNLQDEEQPISQYETGTVLSWKNGKNRPCTQYADHMRMGIAVHGQDSPLIQGAEPVLCTGVVEEGDYLVTSDKKGHAVAVPRNIVKEQMLFDCVIGKALENGDGESHLVKTWINI